MFRNDLVVHNYDIVFTKSEMSCIKSTLGFYQFILDLREEFIHLFIKVGVNLI